MNSLLGIFGEAYGEVLLLAQNFGIDTETIVNAISDSRMSSPLFQEKKICLQTENILRHLC
ncbi:phosphogluconate dehydrogenase, NAD binding domain protein [Leptotrichia wadei]|uniref:Phosphogluconate dehydrogenase, NAD binding domain protein n=1 Tax=Leptotrichia wadei TaxID=157687 RepID=A0A510K4R5_9FUSO|nr:phosphogluconate dehydrogenase, NAD binding domain protein [Leptotrichia wadei]